MGALLRAAVRSARRSPALSLVMVAALTQAAAFWMLTQASHDVETRHLEAQRPALYRVLAPAAAVPVQGRDAWLPNHWSHLLLGTTAAERVRALAPRAVVATFGAPLPVRVNDALSEREVRFATRALFSAFDRPLAAGRAWAPEADANPAVREVVVRDTTARRWFGGDNPLGQTVELAGERFTIVGLVEQGDGQPFDLRFAADGDELFLPWAQALALELTPSLAVPGGGHVNVWAELPGAERERFSAALPEGFSLLPYRTLWERAQFADPAVELFRLFALLALLACAFNMTRLLATRFLLQAPGAAVRRALGASRARLFLAHAGEAALLGLAAAVLAPPLAMLGARLLNHWLLKRVGDYRIDLPLAAAGAGLALATSLAAALFPAWRASQVPPATQLRSM